MIESLDQHLPGADAAAVHALAFAEAQGRTMILPTQVRGQVPAEVSHGRWIVRCPFCPGAQLASFADPRFLCVNCWNAQVGGAWVAVTWPAGEVRAQVEQLLEERPVLEVQNWLPGETVQALREENRAAARGDLRLPSQGAGPQLPFRLPEPGEAIDLATTEARRAQVAAVAKGRPANPAPPTGRRGDS